MRESVSRGRTEGKQKADSGDGMQSTGSLEGQVVEGKISVKVGTKLS